MATHFRVEGHAERFVICATQREARRHCMATEFLHQAGVTGSHCIQRVADVQTTD